MLPAYLALKDKVEIEFPSFVESSFMNTMNKCFVRLTTRCPAMFWNRKTRNEARQSIQDGDI
jgi:hypothetical protein